MQAATGYQNISGQEKNNIPYDFYVAANGSSLKLITDGDKPGCTGSNISTTDVDVTIVDGELASSSIIPNTWAASTLPHMKFVAIAPYAFQGNTTVTSLSTTDCTYLKTIGTAAFRDCTALATATVNAEEIGGHAFEGCTALGTFTLAEGVKKLGNSIVSGTPLTMLSLPASLTSFGYAADGAKNLISIVANSNSATYTSVYGTLYSKDRTRLIRQPEGRDLVSFTDECTSIAYYAFQDCSKLKDLIELPYGMTTIGDYAFLRATGMKKLVIPGSVTSMAGTFLQGCSSLTDLYINKSTAPTATMSKLFGDNYATIVPNITLHLPYAADIKTAYKTAGWTGFKDYIGSMLQAYDFSLDLDNFGKAYYSVTSTGAANYTDEDGVMRGYDGTVKLLRGDGTVAKGEVTIPTVVEYRNKRYGVTSLGRFSLVGDGTETNQFSVKGGWLVKKIENAAGALTQSLTAVNLPNVTTIDNAAFSNSTGLKSFYFSPTITTIDADAFYLTKKLNQDVYLPYGVKTIGKFAFYLSAITTLRIPGSVTTLGDDFIGENASLTQLIVNVPTTAFKNVTRTFGALPNVLQVYVPVGQVEQYKQHKAFTALASKIEAGAFDFIYGTRYTTVYHMSVMAAITGDYTDPDTGDKTHFDGWASYVYHPNIKDSGDYTFDRIETDRLTGKQYLMVALGDSVLAGTASMAWIDGPTDTFLGIGHHTFDGCGVEHDLTFTNPITIGEQAFTNMPNCPSVTILSPVDLSGDFEDSYLFDHNKDGFRFYVDNSYFKKAHDKCMDWDTGHGKYAAQLRPFIRATAEVQPVSCYLDWVNYPENGLKAYTVNDYDMSKKTLKLLEHDADFLNNQVHGVILTGLEVGQIYKLEPSTTNPATVTCSGDFDNYLTENWEQWTLKSDDMFKRWGWNADQQKFVHPATSMTIPGGSALLYIGDSDQALNIDEWTLELEGNNKFDVNNDGNVDVGDVNAILEAILAEKTDAKFDVNGDHSVDVGDVNAVLEYILTH